MGTRSISHRQEGFLINVTVEMNEYLMNCSQITKNFTVQFHADTIHKRLLLVFCSVSVVVIQ